MGCSSSTPSHHDRAAKKKRSIASVITNSAKVGDVPVEGFSFANPFQGGTNATVDSEDFCQVQSSETHDGCCPDALSLESAGTHEQSKDPTTIPSQGCLSGPLPEFSPMPGSILDPPQTTPEGRAAPSGQRPMMLTSSTNTIPKGSSSFSSGSLVSALPSIDSCSGISMAEPETPSWWEEFIDAAETNQQLLEYDAQELYCHFAPPPPALVRSIQEWSAACDL